MKTNLVGRRFGRLVAISCEGTVNGSTRWKCMCDCGNEHILFYSNLVGGSTKSCGKCPLDDLLGKRFSSLLVIKRSISKKNRARWICQCDCGKTIVVTGTSLRNGHCKSCGCRYQLGLIPKNETTLVRSLWGTYKSLAKKRGYSFSLSFEEFQILTKQTCFYCGKEPYQILKPKCYGSQNSYTYNGVDRVDNAKGYQTENTVACCGVCNSFKSNYSQTTFLEHCKLITEFNSKKQAEMTCSAIKSE
jgi:hypothetical protein